MPVVVKDIWEDRFAHLNPLPDQILFDLARNEAAPHDYRKFAVELLLGRKSPRVNHEDLREFVEELKAELDGVQFEYPAPTPQVQGPGPLVASVTTATMSADSVVEADETQIPAKRTRKPKSKPEETTSESDVFSG